MVICRLLGGAPHETARLEVSSLKPSPRVERSPVTCDRFLSHRPRVERVRFTSPKRSRQACRGWNG